jgi:hypothetical protein
MKGLEIKRNERKSQNILLNVISEQWAKKDSEDPCFPFTNEVHYQCHIASTFHLIQSVNILYTFLLHLFYENKIMLLHFEKFYLDINTISNSFVLNIWSTWININPGIIL